jgi:hypothetical protein
MKKILVLSMLFFGISVMAQPPVLTAPGVTEKAAAYYLPKTALRFALKVEGRTFHPGKFCHYSEQYYHLVANKVKETKYSVVNLGLTSIGVTDTTKLYNIILQGKSKGANIVLSPEGQFMAFNEEPQVVKLQPPFQPYPNPPLPDYMSYLPEYIQKAETDSAKVEETVRYLIKLQANIQRIKNGEAADSAFQEPLDKLQERSDVIDKLFFGTTTCDTTEQVIVFIPEREMNKEVIFRLNQQTGKVSMAPDAVGTPYYLTVENMHSTPKQQEELPKDKKIGCVYVNVPCRIKATIHHENTFMGAFDLYAAQFGFVDELSGSLFKNYVTHIKLNPVFGSVDRIRYDMK